jgi:hypothetical protein
MTPEDFRLFCGVFAFAFVAIVIYRRLRTH